MLWVKDRSIDLEYMKIEDAVKYLSELAQQHPGAKFEEFQEEYSNSDRRYLYLMVERLETDAEEQAREKREQEYADRQREHELRTLKALQEKYGNQGG